MHQMFDTNVHSCYRSITSPLILRGQGAKRRRAASAFSRMQSSRKFNEVALRFEVIKKAIANKIYLLLGVSH